MQLPFFFESELPDVPEWELSEESSRHIAQVLRMERKDRIILTDGKGTRVEAEVEEPHRKHTRVAARSRHSIARVTPEVGIAIPLLKNKSRFEWFLEKATEIGVSRILPLVTERTEKSHFRADRASHILVSALLQSEQLWLPEITDPLTLEQADSLIPPGQKYIAHCLDMGPRSSLGSLAVEPGAQWVLIGPEGDFTPNEIQWALSRGYQAITLGTRRLRTETAALVAAVMLLEKAGSL